MSPKLTVGMAHYDDFPGVWATVQSVFLHNQWEDAKNVEVVIVDTSPPGSEHKRLVQGMVNKHLSNNHIIKYVELPEVVGTTYPRDLIFQIATAPYTVVMDCHVMLPPNALLRLSDWFPRQEDQLSLVHGPMWYDDLGEPATHFADQFRGGMWGTWSTVWQSPKGFMFSCEGEEVTDENKLKRPSTGFVSYHDVMTLAPINHPSLPEKLSWPGHQRKLKELGYTQPAASDSDVPFEIPGMGMGLFASRTDAWLGFAKHCSGFGGEELNIHTKYKQAGRKTFCLPFLKWNHRFGRVGGAPYPIPTSAKVRNYVLWANELGNPSFIDHVNGSPVTLLDRIYNHFVAGALFPPEHWAQLIADPINYEVNLSRSPIVGLKPLDALFEEVANKKRDLNEHAESIRNIALQSSTIRAFVKRCEWEPILAAAFPKSLEVYQTEAAPLTQRTIEAVNKQSVKDNRKITKYETHTGMTDPLEVLPTQCDLFVLDRLMEGNYALKVLERHGPMIDRFILLRGSQAFGEVAEGNREAPGLFYAMKQFMAKNPEWFVVVHRGNQYGYTLLSKDPSLLPEKEVRPWPKGYGPGTELKAILTSVGINPGPNCSCRGRMITMDEWGVEGCEQNFDTIVGWLNESADDWGWNSVVTKKAEEGHTTLSLADKLTIGWKSLTTGLAFKVNWSNPYPDLVRRSIDNAREKEMSGCKKTNCDPTTCENKKCKKK